MCIRGYIWRLIRNMLKVGVFGVGHLGKFHLNNWQEIAGTELVGFYDPDDKTAKEVADKMLEKDELSKSTYDTIMRQIRLHGKKA